MILMKEKSFDTAFVPIDFIFSLIPQHYSLILFISA